MLYQSQNFTVILSLAGVSRSVTLVVAYIMTVTGLGWQEVLAAVKVARPCAGPNLGFQRQLQEFETHQAEQVSALKMSIGDMVMMLTTDFQ